MKRLPVFAIVTALSSAAFAAPETYVIDTNHTKPRFEYNHLGYSVQLSRFDKVSGKITIDRAAKTGSVDVVMDAKSVNTGYAVFNEDIQAEDYLYTAKYPTIIFKSTGMKFDGDKLVAVDGKLTIKGITKPLTLTVVSFLCNAHPVYKGKDACGAEAIGKILRSDFHVDKYAPYISDELTLTVPIESIKE